MKNDIYEYVKQQILSGTYKENMKLSERILCEKFNTSRTTVRESIKKLKIDGWLYSVAKSGTYVAEINIKEVVESFDLRIVLEPYMVATAIPYITANDISIMKQNCSMMENCEADKFKKYETDNHSIIERRCTNSMIRKIIVDMNNNYSRITSATTKLSERREASIIEWKNLILAIENKNSEMAKLIMTQHVLNAYYVFLDSIKK